MSFGDDTLDPANQWEYEKDQRIKSLEREMAKLNDRLEAVALSYKHYMRDSEAELSKLRAQLETRDTAVRFLMSYIRSLEETVHSWKLDFNMYRGAWLREIGGVIRVKAHEIDGFVLRTRDIYEKAQKADKLRDECVKLRAELRLKTTPKGGVCPNCW